MNEVSLGVQFFRVRIVLRLTAATRMHAHHAAILYSLLAQANGVARQIDPCIPDGLLLDAPEQARLSLGAESSYAFGFTLLSYSDQDAGRAADLIVQGLRKVGRAKGAARVALGGNFEVELVQDLVSGETHRIGHALQPIGREFIAAEIGRVSERSELHLRFISPLRAHRSKHDRIDGHQFFDRAYFNVRAFMQRLAARVDGLGIVPMILRDASETRMPEVVANELYWLDLSYGPKQTRKALGGAVGEVRIANVDPAFAELLVWGQYTRIGESTRFGFGNFRLRELGDQPFACARGTSLMSLAMESSSLDLAATRWELGAGETREAARRLHAGNYEPQPHFTIDIPKPDGTKRKLAIPSKLDRILQRTILDTIAPALDLFLEESSLAYRKGLGRHTAARRLKQSFDEGFRWALKSDFFDFFDSIDHSELARRLRAYLNDDSLTEILMTWVAAGSPAPGRGIPTGAPISPLLANLFLDEFDEEMDHLGRRLIRYADDFVILFKNRADAEAVFRQAEHAAQALRLELNREKTRTLELQAPFDFLGFQFTSRESWELFGESGPRNVEELGWRKPHRPSQRRR